MYFWRWLGDNCHVWTSQKGCLCEVRHCKWWTLHVSKVIIKRVRFDGATLSVFFISLRQRPCPRLQIIPWPALVQTHFTPVVAAPAKLRHVRCRRQMLAGAQKPLDHNLCGQESKILSRLYNSYLH